VCEIEEALDYGIGLNIANWGVFAGVFMEEFKVTEVSVCVFDFL